MATSLPHIPLFAGVELTRRQGALTTYPPELLVPNLPDDEGPGSPAPPDGPGESDSDGNSLE